MESRAYLSLEGRQRTGLARLSLVKTQVQWVTVPASPSVSGGKQILLSKQNKSGRVDKSWWLTYDAAGHHQQLAVVAPTQSAEESWRESGEESGEKDEKG